MRWEAQPPTEAQIRALERFGVAAPAVTCKDTSMLMGKMIERSRMKLASVGKLKVLARYGFEDLGVISEKEANGLMDRIKAGNWQQPENWSFA